MTLPPHAEYVAVIHGLATTKNLSGVPAAVTASEWLRKNDHVVLALSPSVGAFADWLITESGEPADYDRESWLALSEHIAWYAAYMDVLLNRRSLPRLRVTAST